MHLGVDGRHCKVHGHHLLCGCLHLHLGQTNDFVSTLLQGPHLLTSNYITKLTDGVFNISIIFENLSLNIYRVFMETEADC